MLWVINVKFQNPTVANIHNDNVHYDGKCRSDRGHDALGTSGFVDDVMFSHSTPTARHVHSEAIINTTTITAESPTK